MLTTASRLRPRLARARHPAKLSATMPIEFGLLGPLEIRRDGAVVPLRARKQRLLLADLLVHRSRIVSTDVLIEDLWPDSPPKTAGHAVEVHASKLREVLGDDGPPLVKQPSGYVL